jgi:IS5 family transposase
MHQVKKGNEWYFGMKMHIGVDDALGLIHSITTTPANVHDITQADRLLHGEESRVWGDAGYQGIQKRTEHEGRDVDWHVAMRPGKRRKLVSGSNEASAEKIKAQVRAKVEHPFRYIKRVFGYDKVRYRGMVKNNERLHMLAAFTNLIVGKKYLLT